MKPLVIVGSALLVALGGGCGGGGSSSSPSAPTTTTPTPAQTGGTVTVYVSSDRSSIRVQCSSVNASRCSL